jgi:ubiquitin C-terminal hydrolase
MQGGHYTAFCLNEGNWYKFDDHKISPINEKSVVSSAAYILFYKRREENTG